MDFRELQLISLYAKVSPRLLDVKLLLNSYRTDRTRCVTLGMAYVVAHLSLDLLDTLQSLSGIASAFHALWDGIINSRRVLASVSQVFFFWLASFILHVTMPTLVLVNTATVSTDVLINVDTIPGNIIDLGANLTLLGSNDGLVADIYSEDLLDTMAALPYIWENRGAPIHLPLGVDKTSVSLSTTFPCQLSDALFRSLFSTPSNVSSSEYVIMDPYAHNLSVRCGVIPLPVDVTGTSSLEYHMSNGTSTYRVCNRHS